MHPERPFPLPPEKVRDLKEDIKAMLAGTYVTDPALTLDGLRMQLRALREQIKGSDTGPLTSKEIEGHGEGILKIIESMKPERNALLAIMTSSIWNDPTFTDERARLLTTNQLMKIKFAHLVALFADTAEGWFLSKEVEKPPYKGWIDRFNELSSFSEQRLLGSITPVEDAEFIVRGMSTAEIAASSLAEIVLSKFKDLHEESISPSQILATLQRAYRNIGLMLASMNIDIGIALMKHLVKDPSFFELRKEKGEYVLYLLPDRLSQLENDYGERVLEARPFGDTTRCPAMYPVGDEQAVVSEFFKYALALVESSSDFPKD